MPAPNLTPIKNPSPRELFRESADNITQHRNLVDSVPFGKAVQFGLLEYQIMLANQTRDANSALAVGYKLQGAIELLSVIRNLAESPLATAKMPSQQLNHKI